jgi:hypothetical protein
VAISVSFAVSRRFAPACCTITVDGRLGFLSNAAGVPGARHPTWDARPMKQGKF